MASESNANNMSFLDHLEQLRWHLIRSTVAVMIGTVLAFLNKSFLFDTLIFGPKSPTFWTYVQICQWSQAIGANMFCFEEMPFTLLNTKMAGQFSTHIWVSLIAGIIIAFPYILFEVWRFVKPGLHAGEARASKSILSFGGLLFFTGVLFGYFIIVPLSIQFLGTYTISDEVNNLIDLSSFISTVTSVTLACGLLFELPILVYFGARLGFITSSMMKTYRRHAIVVIMVLSAVITPPDVASQILVTLPVLVLYEVGIVIVKRVEKQQKTA
ncbi:MAG: twin-arginine translocase subunit TatC [Schleiferiaceae bacterium]